MSQPSWIGYTLGGRYEIEELIGQGGMSTVYKATDPNLRRTVAVKLIHPHLSSKPEFVRRFREEAAAVAQLSHPNIIQVFDFNNEGDTYYMVLEYLLGESLQERLKRLNESGRQLPVTEVIEIMASVCDAVDYAHKRNMVHRDIKPANIMLTTQGQAKLMDFGVVKMLGAKEYTATGAVIGTALYMSPEQARGEHPDSRADIYSLGVTLYEMTSGHPPFEADSAMTTMMMHVNDPVPDILERNPNTPIDLKAVIEKALAKSPANRYQTAAAMATDLRRVLSKLQGAPAGATFIEDPAGVDTAHGMKVEAENTFLETPVYEASPEVSRASTKPVSATDMKRSSTPAPQAAPRASKPARKSILPIVALVGGGGFIAIVVVAVVAFVLLGGFGGGSGSENNKPTPSVDQGGGENIAAAAEPTSTTPPTAAPTDQPVAVPSETPTPAMTATPTVPPGIHYVRINSITLEGSTYVVDFEAFEYTPVLPGEHVHFFFNTVTPENAGYPGAGPWYLYGGPNPFTGYTTGDKPGAATQMCALVANPDHSIQMNSGNCVYLP